MKLEFGKEREKNAKKILTTGFGLCKESLCFESILSTLIDMMRPVSMCAGEFYSFTLPLFFFFLRKKHTLLCTCNVVYAGICLFMFASLNEC